MTNSVEYNKRAYDATLDATGESIQVGFCTGVTIEANGSLTPVGEPVGVGGYVEVTVPVSDFGLAMRDGSLQRVTGANQTAVTFPDATADWGVLTHAVLRSASEVVSIVTLITPLTVMDGDTASIPAESLALTIS